MQLQRRSDDPRSAEEKEADRNALQAFERGEFLRIRPELRRAATALARLKRRAPGQEADRMEQLFLLLKEMLVIVEKLTDTEQSMGRSEAGDTVDPVARVAECFGLLGQHLELLLGSGFPFEQTLAALGGTSERDEMTSGFATPLECLETA